MTGYSVNNINPYYYQAMGVRNNTNTPPVSNVNFTSNPNTILDANKETKGGLSNGAKWAIGLGLTALAAGGIYLATKGKVGSKNAKKIFAQVEFKPAQSIEEAKSFAKNNLGVYIKGDLPLDVLNYTNEGLCLLKNKAPKSFSINWIESSDIAGGYAEDAMAQVLKIDGKEIFGIKLSQNYIKNIDKILTECINGEVERKALVNINGKLEYDNFYKKADISTEISQLINKFRQNPASLTFKEKVRLHMGLEDIGETMDKLYIKHHGDISKLDKPMNIISSEFHPILHEQGHILHQKKNPNQFSLLDQIDVLKQKGLNTSQYDEFADKYKVVASKVSDYATESPAEFVAEVYAKSLNGAKFDKDILDLYAKYCGPALT